MDTLLMHGDRIAALIVINGRRRVATIDTGSTRSIISADIASQIKTDSNHLKVGVKILLADGSNTNVSQAMAVEILLGQTRTYIVTLVMPNVMDDVLLGLDFLRRTRAVLHVGPNHLCLFPLPFERRSWQAGDRIESRPNAMDLAKKRAVSWLALEETIPKDNSYKRMVQNKASIATWDSSSICETPAEEDWVVAPTDWWVTTPDRRLPSMLIEFVLNHIEMGGIQRRRFRRQVDGSVFRVCISAAGRVIIYPR
ncbi:uncharacterized protein [Drosophila virilis]|nr:uncharacterized protein LOC26531142 isoform X2 [Drosophila virilis]XP_032292414.1 uncharacterized protein LOC26531142 isoform X2 [Drosophila virilis]KRF82910.1 uncharacterized protein Dvir_GJ26372, isoform A [Drosophila virilis]